MDAQIGEVVTTIPTIGFNVESVTYKNLNFNVWVRPLCHLFRVSLTSSRISVDKPLFDLTGDVTMPIQPQ